MNKKLLIIMYDDLNNLINKGEIVKRYYNPCNYFEEIHFFLINQKKIKKKNLLRLVGNSKLFVHYTNINIFEKFLLLFKLFFLSSRLKKKINHIVKINPSIVRCYNLNYQIFLAEYLKKIHKIPYVISIHFDLQNHILKWGSFKKLLFNFLKIRLNNILRNSDLLLPVYSSATRYLKKNNIYNFKVLYNFINFFPRKRKKLIDKNFHLICVNRQYRDKNPINIIKAINKIPQTKLTLIGDGNLHKYLKKFVKNKRLSKKVFFIKKINNEKYLKNLLIYDAFISNNYANEFSKGMIEAISHGLPIIVNKQNYKIKELNKKISLENNDTPEGYKRSILKLMKNKSLYKELSRNSKNLYLKKYDTLKAELEFKKIYEKLLTTNKF